MAGGGRSYEMARRLVAAGHEVHMITSDQKAMPAAEAWRNSLEAGIQVHWAAVPYDNVMSYPRRMRAFAKFAWSSARKAASLRADVVFASSTPLSIALPGAYAARLSRCPMVFEVRDLWPAVPIAIGAIRNPAMIAAARLLERFAYQNAARIVALAPGMRDEVIAAGYPADRISVIPNGCDFDIFSDAATGMELRQEYDWLGSRPLLVFTGTFGLVNGMDYLPRLAAEILRVDREIRIVAVGTGREFQPTSSLAERLGVLNQNLFLLGQRSRQEAAAWTSAANVNLALFAGPAIVWRDAVQNKFFDSLAAGRPVASNFEGWQSRIAQDAGAGVILPANDVFSAARTIARLLRDEEWLRNAGRAARHMAEARFNRDDLAQQMLEVLVAAYAERRASCKI